MRRSVIGLLGTTLDRGEGPDRWTRWRPSVSLCQHEDLLVDRFVLIFEPKFAELADTVAADVRSVSPETDVSLRSIAFGDAWDFEQVYGALYDFAREFGFDSEREEYLVHITTGSHVSQICLYLLTESRHIPGRLLQTSPPRRRSTNEPGEYVVIDLDLARYDRIAQRFSREQNESRDFLKSGIETRSSTFNRMIEQIEHVAIHSTDPILLTGPTGAGKSHLARKIYDLKKRRRQIDGAFVDVNCATLRGDTSMSALFGHRKGAFTGATGDRKGLLVEASGGLLFLDEIGELGHDEQAMLLRAVEERTFLPVGSDREVRSEFQLICGTNRDLLSDVASGRFRHDLLARIHLWSFRLPGLVERREDIEPNLRYELEAFARTTGRNVRFNREAEQRFLTLATSPSSRWTGNFRDLNAAIRRMGTMAPSGRITLEVVEDEIARLTSAWSVATASATGVLAEVLGEPELDGIDLFDRLQLESVIAVCRASDSLSDAGRKLFAVSRAKKSAPNDADRLRKYLGRFGLSWNAIARASSAST